MPETRTCYEPLITCLGHSDKGKVEEIRHESISSSPVSRHSSCDGEHSEYTYIYNAILFVVGSYSEVGDN